METCSKEVVEATIRSIDGQSLPNLHQIDQNMLQMPSLVNLEQGWQTEISKKKNVAIKWENEKNSGKRWHQKTCGKNSFGWIDWCFKWAYPWSALFEDTPQMQEASYSNRKVSGRYLMIATEGRSKDASILRWLKVLPIKILWISKQVLFDTGATSNDLSSRLCVFLAWRPENSGKCIKVGDGSMALICGTLIALSILFAENSSVLKLLVVDDMAVDIIIGMPTLVQLEARIDMGHNAVAVTIERREVQTSFEYEKEKWPYHRGRTTQIVQTLSPTVTVPQLFPAPIPRKRRPLWWCFALIWSWGKRTVWTLPLLTNWMKICHTFPPLFAAAFRSCCTFIAWRLTLFTTHAELMLRRDIILNLRMMFLLSTGVKGYHRSTMQLFVSSWAWC